MRSVNCVKAFSILLFVGSTAYGQNLVPINPGAELGNFNGWTPQTLTYGAAQTTDQLDSATIGSSASNVADGTYSFHLHDGSATTYEQMLSSISSSNRVPLQLDTHYLITFDVKIVSGPVSPVDPTASLRYFNSSSGSTPVETRIFNLQMNSNFASTTPAANGFTQYAVNEFFSSSGPSPMMTPIFCEISFNTDTSVFSTSDMYIDDISVIVVPESGNTALMLIMSVYTLCRILRVRAKIIFTLLVRVSHV